MILCNLKEEKGNTTVGLGRGVDNLYDFADIFLLAVLM